MRRDVWEKQSKAPLTFLEAVRGGVAWIFIGLALRILPRHFYEHPILEQAFHELDENAEVFRRQR